LSRTHELEIAWFAGANGTAGLDTAGDDLSIAVSQYQSTAIEAAISYITITNTTDAQTAGFTTPGTIGNNVIGSASFQPGGDAYVESTTGLNLTDAILRFYFYADNTEAPDDDLSIGGLANSADASFAAVVLDGDGQVGLAGLDFIDYSGIYLTDSVWHLIELRVRIDNSEGANELWVDGQLAASRTGIDTDNGTGNIDRGFIGADLAGADQDPTEYFYDDFEIINLEVAPESAYVADKLYLQNVKVDVLQVTADIVGWDFLQRVWPSARADQATFPGLFR